VLLPIVLVALAFASSGALAGAEWSRLGLELLLLGPGAGILVGLFGLATLDLVRRRIGVQRDYESLYSLGIAFAAYAAAESVHGSGFLAAFAAGITIAFFDVELCDCFREYGETTAELALLLTFVLLGSSLIWTGSRRRARMTLLFAALRADRAARPLSRGVRSRAGRSTARGGSSAWFGPRGLSSLLLALLAVFAGLPEAAEIFRVACLVVLLSILLHGGTLVWIGRRAPVGQAPELITAAEVQALLAGGETVVPVDVRKEVDWQASNEWARGAVRLSPDRPAADARVHGPARRHLARALLHVTERGDECPCGTRVEKTGLAPRASADRRLRRVEGGRARRGGEAGGIA
jgi:NhaP-type Na+/H+ or K+/H+ antiporter